MRGHVRHHGKGWVVVVDTGQQNGKRQQRWHSGYATKREAEKALAELLRKIDGDEYVKPTTLTVGEYLNGTWLPSLDDQVQARTKRPTTVAQYRTLAETHIIPNLGCIKLRSLNAVHLDRLYGELLRSGRRRPSARQTTGLSTTTVRAVHVTISAALTHAVRKSILSRNVARLADPPSPAEHEQQVWTAHQTATFLETVQSDRLFPLYLVAATCGLRRGELCGLRWESVDIDARKLTVASARVIAGTQVLESGPKTAKAKRNIAVAPPVVEALRSHKARQAAERLAWGPAWQDTKLVFTREDGTGYHPNYITTAFKRAARRAGLPVIPLHALRHGHATDLLRAGVDIRPAPRRLGHASVAITGDIYSHVVEELDREAADATAALLTPNRVTAKSS